MHPNEASLDPTMRTSLANEAPAPALHAAIRGSNQAGVRAHNERVVLSLIRRHGALAKAEIARQSGLSAQTVTVIMRALEADGLVLPGAPQRGRVGQPSVPMRLNARGAFSLGLKIGRRTSETVLMDFSGAVLGHDAVVYDYPRRGAVMEFARTSVSALTAGLPEAERGRIAGLGVGLPAELWAWAVSHRASEAEGDEWRRGGIADELAAAVGLPVFEANDATAACGAEQAFGTTGLSDYVYVFVGAFVGGGIVIDGRLVPGRSGNAGALGSLPVPSRSGGVCQLIEEASIHVLERDARAAGLRGNDLWRADARWEELGAILDDWILRAGRGLAHAALAASAVYDFEAAIVDGSFSPDIRRRLTGAAGSAFSSLDRRGLSDLRFEEGTIGRAAREIGAASLPFFARYFLDHRVLHAESGGAVRT